jgi:hypothetical protein
MMKQDISSLGMKDLVMYPTHDELAGLNIIMHSNSFPCPQFPSRAQQANQMPREEDLVSSRFAIEQS